MRKRIVYVILILGCILCFAINAGAKVKLPVLVSDGMVLQREQPVLIWGFADPGEEIKIQFLKKKYHTQTGMDGKWQIQLPPTKAGGPYTITINDIVLKDVLFGDVWLCSGQSNMETPVSRVMDLYEKEIRSYTNTHIRHIKIPLSYNFHGPQDDIRPAAWMPVTPEGIMTYAAVPYFFARFLYETIQVPIGLINASVGGSPAEAWVNEENLREFPYYLNDKKIAESDEYIRQAQQLQDTNRKLWYQVLNEGDSGLLEKWIDPAYNDSNWDTTDLFDSWGRDEKQSPINGSFWFRKAVDIPVRLAGKKATLRLGCIVDADSVFVNGVFIGATSYQYPPRKYPIPETLLKEGKNTITIRLISHSDTPHFVEEKPYKIVFEEEEISLEGEWKYRLANRMPSMSEGISFQYKPVGLYNAMIAPLQNYVIKGVVWYQGESNTSRYKEYNALLSALINNWRELWKQPDLPFLLVQLPNFQRNYPGESEWAELRNVQRELCMNTPNTGLAVTIDVGEWNDIHPLNKKDVGYRLSLQARRLVYGENTIIVDGPLYESKEIAGNKIILTFRKGTDDFMPMEELKGFAIAGRDGEFQEAKARIENGKIIVWNDGIADPVQVRYAWANNPEEANLRNRTRLPASPFRTE
ncbi:MULTISPECIES: sialate O-acetylesterase [unclassified Parabacteroides]|uniref:sialate O-acetylesterase n=1 Tax=unclassified Parabacteroides TaxID=2649774 RepID=UPI0024742BE1|nr:MULTISPECIES: sialate O-acetylesterase [unclassified Parabacteroides]